MLRADNAAVALRLLGQHDRLVWYVPSLDDLVGDDGVSLTTLLPDWLRPGLWLAALAVLALLLWRGAPARTAGHRAPARRRQGDRDHPEPGPALPPGRRPRARRRRAAGRRPRPRRRPAAPRRRAPTTDALVRDVARHTGRPVEEIDALLARTPRPPPPTTT